MNTKNPWRNIRPRGQRFIRAVLLLFGLAFAAVLAISVYRISTELGGWYGGRNWQQGAAEIEALNLQSGSRKGSGKRFTTVRYRYRVDGVDYLGQRIGWSDSMQVGGWHKRQYQALVDIQNHSKLAPIWYDPSKPSQAVIDRGLRWGLLLLFFPLGLFFGAISAAFFGLAVRGEFRSGR